MSAGLAEAPSRSAAAGAVPVPGRLPALGAWWLSPLGAVLLVAPASLIGAWLIPDARYRSEWRTPKELTGSFTVLLVLGLVAFVLGVACWQLRTAQVWRGRWPALSAGDLTVLHRAGTWVFRATIAGYVALGCIGLARGVSPLDLVKVLVTLSTDDALKESFAPVAGLTTFTQLGIAYAVIAGLLIRRRRAGGQLARRDRLVRRRLWVLLVLAALRAFLLSERLAVLELVVPLVGIVALRLSVAPRRRVRRSVKLAPVVLLPLLVAVFGAFEYARSWQYYAAHGGTSFVDFVLVRFAGYYATAYNNAAIAYAHAGFPGRLPYSSVEFLWTAPGVSQLDLYRRLTGESAPDQLQAALDHYGNLEFNNPGGLGIPFADLGPVGGVLCLLGMGLVAGWCWHSLRSGRPAGMLLYPVFLIGLFEMPRYLYLSQGRVLPALVVLALVARRLDRGGPSPVGLRLRRRLLPGFQAPTRECEIRA